MSQMEDFREVLGLKKSDIPVVKEKTEESAPAPESSQPTDKRRNLSIPINLHTRMKLLCFWMQQKDLSSRPTMTSLCEEMFNTYLEQNPDAKDFLEKHLR